MSFTIILLPSPDNVKLSIFILTNQQYFTWIYIALNVDRYATNLENRRVDLFEGPGEGVGEDNVLLASGKCML